MSEERHLKDTQDWDEEAKRRMKTQGKDDDRRPAEGGVITAVGDAQTVSPLTVPSTSSCTVYWTS